MTVKTVDPEDTLAVLKAAEEWLSDPEHWTKGRYWENAAGWFTERHDEVCRTCLAGALSLVSDRSPGCWPRHAEYALDAAFNDGMCAMVRVNDREGYAAVMAGLRQAIEAEEAKR